MLRAHSKATVSKAARSASFFSLIQGYFHSDFSGRYIAILLSEVCRIDPAPFRTFFEEVFNSRRYRKGLIELEPEFTFPTRQGYRRADLLVRLDGTPVALVELKFRDKLLPEDKSKPAQLSDYLRICKSNQLRFLLLSKEPPTFDEIAQIKAQRQRRAHFSLIAMALARSSQPASEMLYAFFREKGLVVEPLKQDVLYRFFHRMLKPWGQAGRINSRDTLSEGPVQCQALLSNMRLVASDLSPRIKPANDGARSRAPTIDFHIAGYFSRSLLELEIKRLDSKETILAARDDARRGGIVYVYTLHSLTGRARKWLHLEYGLGFEVRPGKTRTLGTSMYAMINGQGFGRDGIETFESWTIAFNSLAKPENKGELEDAFMRLIRIAAKRALKAPSLDRQRKALLERLA